MFANSDLDVGTLDTPEPFEAVVDLETPDNLQTIWQKDGMFPSMGIHQNFASAHTIHGLLEMIRRVGDEQCSGFNAQDPLQQGGDSPISEHFRAFISDAAPVESCGRIFDADISYGNKRYTAMVALSGIFHEFMEAFKTTQSLFYTPGKETRTFLKLLFSSVCLRQDLYKQKWKPRSIEVPLEEVAPELCSMNEFTLSDDN